VGGVDDAMDAVRSASFWLSAFGFHSTSITVPSAISLGPS
jgi:hypothetical protein